MIKTLLLLTACLSCLVFSAHSQLSYEWADAFTGSEVFVNDVDHDPSGNAYIIGTFTGTADFDPGPGTALRNATGNIDMFMAKYDADGNFVWANNFPTQFSGWGVMPFQLKIAQNSIYIGATFLGSTDFDPGPGNATLTTFGNLGPVFGRYDLNGNYLWAKTAGTLNNDHITGIDVDAAGNFYISFVSGGTSPDFDPGPGVAAPPINWNDGVFAKYDSMGNYIFAKTFRSTSGNWHPMLDIAVDNTGSIFVVGTFESTIDVDPDAGIVNLTANGFDGYIVKLNATGNYVWHGQFTGPGDEIPAALECDLNDNTIYCGGSFASPSVDFNIGPGTASLAASNGANGFVAKYTAAGGYEWAVNVNGNNTESVADLYLDACRNICAAGTFNASSMDLDPSGANTNFATAGQEDVFLAKYTDAGAYMYGMKAGGPGGDFAGAVSVNPFNGTNSLCGYFNGTADFDPGTGTANRTAVGANNGFLGNYSEAPIPPADITPPANLSICPGDSTVLIVDGSATGTVYWYDQAGNIIGSGDTLYTGPIGPGNSVFYFKDSLLCLPSSDLDSIVIGNGSINVSIAASDTIICIGSTATLTASGAGSYTWFPGPYTTDSITVSPATNTTYTVVGQSGTCIDSAQVTISVVPPPNVSIQGDTLLCAGESTTLVASGATSYTWLPPNSSNDSLTVTPGATTVYSVIGHSGSCTDTAQITVTVVPLPVISVQGTDTICPGGTAVLEAQGAATYTWSPNVNFLLPDGSRVEATPAATTTYTVTGTDAAGLCSSTAQATVTMVYGINMTLTATPNPVSADYPLVYFQGTPASAVLTWHFGDSTSTEAANTQHLYPQGVEGTYTVMLIAQTNGGCSDTLWVDILVQAGGTYYVPNAFTPDGDEFNNVFQPVFSLGFDAAKYELEIYDRWGERLFGTDQLDEGWDGTYKDHMCMPGVYTWRIRFGDDENAWTDQAVGSVTLVR